MNLFLIYFFILNLKEKINQFTYEYLIVFYSTFRAYLDN